MDHLTAAALGLVQGLTEFLPVSSSGHVAVAALLWGETPLPLAGVVLLHVGTLLATLAVVGRDAARLGGSLPAAVGSPRRWLRSEDGRQVLGIGLATVVTGVVGLTLEPLAEQATGRPEWLAAGFVVTALVLVLASRRGGSLDVPGLPAALLVGLAQGLAVLPGVSRSGSTIAAALLLGLRPEAAFRFSFLISIPAIVGAVVLEAARPDGFGRIEPALWTGGLVAFLSGLLALLALRRLVRRGRLWVFAPYLVALAAFLWFRSAP